MYMNRQSRIRAIARGEPVPDEAAIRAYYEAERRRREAARPRPPPVPAELKRYKQTVARTPTPRKLPSTGPGGASLQRTPYVKVTELNPSDYSVSEAKAEKKNLILILPGEIRNAVYFHVHKDGCHAAFMDAGPADGADGADFARKLMDTRAGYRISACPTIAPDSSGERKFRTRTTYKHVGAGRARHAQNTKWETSFSALNVSCKQIHAETNSFLYENTTFYFQDPHRLTCFLTNTPSVLLQHVKTLHIAYRTYGTPTQPKNRWIKDMADKSFADACTKAALGLPNLESLHIALDVSEPVDDVKFTLGEKWLQPIYAFSPYINPAIAHSKTVESYGGVVTPRLRDVQIAVRCSETDPNWLYKAQRHNDHMMRSEPERYDYRLRNNWIQRDYDLLKAEHREAEKATAVFERAVRKYMCGATEEGAMKQYHATFGPGGAMATSTVKMIVRKRTNPITARPAMSW